jgi:FMN reductase
MSNVGIVVGNPKARSRTLTLAEEIATAAAEVAGLDGADRLTVDLADVGPLLFDWSSARVRVAVEGIRSCSLVVVASPTYKASYTGLLKSFLDWFSTTDLGGATVIPVMTGAGAQHALAVEVHLRPVLGELGASLPTRGLYVTEADLADPDDVISTWLRTAGPLLRQAVTAGRGAG